VSVDEPDRRLLPGVRAAAGDPQREDFADYAEHEGLELITE
jgi:hypothetical protein